MPTENADLPSPSKFSDFDAVGLAELVRTKQVTSLELVDDAIAKIEALNPSLNAVIYKAYDLARAAAAGAVVEGAFGGVPFLLKDLATPWAGVPTTNGSFYYKDFIAQSDSDYSRRIKAAGFLLVGKTNVPENGWCLSTEPALWGPTKNPWNPSITAGGSSGGAASAVAARMVPLADASDGAGSIRVPASNNGLVGLKPSRGRISLGPDGADFWYGGALFLCVSRTVRDTAGYLDAVSGALPGEPYQHPPRDRSFLSEVGNSRPLRIGFTTKSPDSGPVHPEAKLAVERTVALCRDLGHSIEEYDLRFDFDRMWRTYTRITAVQSAMGFDAAAPVIGRPVTASDVMPTTWAIIERGRSISGIEHAQDVELARLFSREISLETDPFDVFITPTLTQPPRQPGHWDMTEPSIDTYNAIMGPDCVYTAPFNVSGQPGISLPLHWTSDGLPIGVQLVGRFAEEAVLLGLAGDLEQAAPWGHRRPPLSA